MLLPKCEGQRRSTLPPRSAEALPSALPKEMRKRAGPPVCFSAVRLISGAGRRARDFRILVSSRAVFCVIPSEAEGPGSFLTPADALPNRGSIAMFETQASARLCVIQSDAKNPGSVLLLSCQGEDQR
jgi:hypothetical protein